MNADCAIAAEGLGKCYRVYSDPWSRTLEWLPGKRVRHRDVWALRDVSFRLEHGSCLGVIGRNGSGKSTLLKILTGVSRPTMGQVRLVGRVLSLLELGTGFNPDLTGRRNVLASASLLGLPATFARSKMDEIEAFADIGPHFDHPVRTYSSGMFVRLAFAVYMHMEPEIFIVDEALSVGDIFFQQKCAAAMRSMRDRGVTLLFASHDMTAVQEWCDQAILLDHGLVVEMGAPTQVIARYVMDTSSDEAASSAPSVAQAHPTPPPTEDSDATLLPRRVSATPASLGELIRRDDRLAGQLGSGSGGCRIEALRVIDVHGAVSEQFPAGEAVGVQALIRVNVEIGELNFGVDLTDVQDRSITCLATSNLGIWLGPQKAGTEVVVTAWLHLSVPPGRYRISPAVGAVDRLNPYAAQFHDVYRDLLQIIVTPPVDGREIEGIAELPILVEAFGASAWGSAHATTV